MQKRRHLWLLDGISLNYRLVTVKIGLRVAGSHVKDGPLSCWSISDRNSSRSSVIHTPTVVLFNLDVFMDSRIAKLVLAMIHHLLCNLARGTPNLICESPSTIRNRFHHRLCHRCC